MKEVGRLHGIKIFAETDIDAAIIEAMEKKIKSQWIEFNEAKLECYRLNNELAKSQRKIARLEQRLCYRNFWNYLYNKFKLPK